jgi:hypothetical protein
MPTATCPNCGQTFTDPKYQSKAVAKMKRHRDKRENPCTSKEYTVKRHPRSPPPNIESLNLNGLVESISKYTRDFNIISFIFKKLNETNKFVVWPNTKLPEVIYRSQGEAVFTTPTRFFVTFWHEVIQAQVRPVLQKEWPRYPEFVDYMNKRTTWKFFEVDVWKQSMLNAFYQSEVFEDMKETIVSHLKSVPRGERCQLKVDMTSQTSYTFDEILYETLEGVFPWRAHGEPASKDERVFEEPKKVVKETPEAPRSFIDDLF